MKKTYISPVTMMVRVNTQQMIASSTIGFGGPLKGDEAVSRYRNSLWEDDEDDWLLDDEDEF
ncbi:MAG: hypothetical protein IJT98_09790 [Prevotella sp.]|nr:hypothetical protein [Prevotella sp.]